MATPNFYSKVGIETPDKRVHPLLAALIIALFIAILYYLYHRYMPDLRARNAAAMVEETSPAPVKKNSASQVGGMAHEAV
jgi:hypothetical protein